MKEMGLLIVIFFLKMQLMFWTLFQNISFEAEVDDQYQFCRGTLVWMKTIFKYMQLFIIRNN